MADSSAGKDFPLGTEITNKETLVQTDCVREQCVRDYSPRMACVRTTSTSLWI
jgi:hypothetical protein